MNFAGVTMDLKQRRLEKNWSQEQLADISGVSSRTIQRIENGAKPGLETLKALAAGLEVSVADLQEEGSADEATERPELEARLSGTWKAFVLNLFLFLVVETWVLFLARYFELSQDVAATVAFLWGGVLVFHLVMVVRKDP